MSNVNAQGEILTLVIDKLPVDARMQGAIGQGSPNIIIYSGKYQTAVPVDNIVAFTDRPINLATGAAEWRLCVFERASYVSGGNAVGELVLDMFTAAGQEPLSPI